VTTPLRRAGGFAAVGTLSLAAPVLGRAAALPFVAVAALAVLVVDDGPLFDLFARPADEREGRLGGLAGFALAAAGLALLATLPAGRPTIPATTFAAAVLVVGYGGLGARAVERRASDPAGAAAGYAGLALVAATLGQVAVAATLAAPVDIPAFVLLAAVGALVGALVDAVLHVRDDPLVMLSVGLVLWAVGAIVGPVGPAEVALALGVAAGLGYVAIAVGTASVPGMLTGVLLCVLTVVLGGLAWFAVLVAFFVGGGLSTKFRYERKRSRGVAEDNDGARGTGNVLGNSAVALGAVVGFAAVPLLPVGEAVFRYAFAGAVATAMCDTFSSEIGGLFDGPRLITSLERVEPGTDGGITWQGVLAGAAGAAAVAAVATLVLPAAAGPVAVAGVALAGVAGMLVDSLLGATLEGGRVGNQAVNFLATLSGAGLCVAIGVLA
jgi:uncharacterized protein (TIGR00297 family)